jgi:CyaY protein
MDESTFDKIGRAELAHLEDRLADVDPDDIEVNSADGMLTLVLRDGIKVVVNTHRAARQIWMAAVTTAWHFDPPTADGGGWRAGNGDELRETLARVLRDRVGVAVTF